jgi:hypothetical protein
MNKLRESQVVELFHLTFLDVLSTRLDPSQYVLKGGANLRYFFTSVRYSEDIDLDMSGVEPWRLADKVDAILDTKPIEILLRPNGLAVESYTKPKQTNTTRRWKVGIEAEGHSHPVRTKIEFSNRNGEERHRLDQVPRSVVAPYGLRSPKVQHYIDAAPTEQKINALADRNETQARDVFDLDLLLRRAPLVAGTVDRETLEKAAAGALELSFAAFRDQVLPFLEPDAVELYDSKSSWEEMQTFVAETLEQAR